MVEKLPKFHETFIQILEVLNKHGTLHYKELRRLVRDNYYADLPAELATQETSTGANTLFDRIGWGKSHLRMAKLLDYPRRSMVEITEKGKTVVQQGAFTRYDLKRDADYLAYLEARAAKKQSSAAERNEEGEEAETIDNLSPQDMIDSGFSAIESQIKGELLERLKKTDPYDFEKVILKVLNKMGYGDMIETSKSRDGGIDGVINQDQLGLEKIYIQAKRYTDNKVQETEIRNFIGAMSGDTSKGVFVTTSDFSDAAIKKASDAHHSISLVDGEKFADLMYQHGVGVQVRTRYEIKEVDDDFFEDGTVAPEIETVS